jgi:Ca2+-binding EF-hand superfamily protein
MVEVHAKGPWSVLPAPFGSIPRLQNTVPSLPVFGNALRQRDANGDGKLDREELPQALFDRLDQDKDGFVSESELKSLRRGNRSE